MNWNCSEYGTVGQHLISSVPEFTVSKAKRESVPEAIAMSILVLHVKSHVLEVRLVMNATTMSTHSLIMLWRSSIECRLTNEISFFVSDRFSL